MLRFKRLGVYGIRPFNVDPPLVNPCPLVGIIIGILILRRFEGGVGSITGLQ